MGMTEEFETSLQVIRGFDTDISIEVNEIKVMNFSWNDLTAKCYSAFVMQHYPYSYVV